MHKIRDKPGIEWRHISSVENPSGFDSQGFHGHKLLKLWLKGPEWPPYPDQLPVNIATATSEESEWEAKLPREVLVTAADKEDVMDEALNKYNLRKTCESLHGCYNSQEIAEIRNEIELSDL